MAHRAETRVGLLRLTGYEAVDVDADVDVDVDVDRIGKGEQEQEQEVPLSYLTALSSTSPPQRPPSPEFSFFNLPPPLYWFPRFLALPQELRERVYTHALAIENAILPHLCDQASRTGDPKFHDDNGVFHNFVAKLLDLTRVSRKIRSESLPIFYEQNTFAVGPDTLTYFAFLQRVGRFDRTDGEIEMHEERRHESSRGRGSACTAEELRAHPRYRVGGVSGLNLALVLRMLSTTTSPDASRIVLPVSNPATFREHPGLHWFQSLVKGLGMELRFVVRPGTARLTAHMAEVKWQRRFQGQEYAGKTVATTSGVADRQVLKRALDMYPDLEEMQRPNKTCYYRRPCRSRGEITWYHMHTLGGGRW
ncbi:hypothetical protein ST47_g668 [Ascochyta rabiei]|uniref:Uncharacterized protein n=1 Tax=Didymella rabiei TaxID=5454 RepID=A0A163LW28_DIDRA|nr:hypothetical protein ST47_g668 [Ascochyta rabiei]